MRCQSLIKGIGQLAVDACRIRRAQGIDALMGGRQYIGVILLQGVDTGSQLLQLHVSFSIGQQQRGTGFHLEKTRGGQRATGGIKAGLVGVTEKSCEGIKVANGNRIVLVIMTTGAAHRVPQYAYAKGLDTIDGVFVVVFLIKNAVFRTALAQTQEGCGKTLFASWIRQQVPGHLPGQEIIEWHVVLVGTDHPVTPGVQQAVTGILQITVGIRPAGNVQPLGCHVFGMGSGGQQPVHQVFVGIRRRISNESIHIFQ